MQLLIIGILFSVVFACILRLIAEKRGLGTFYWTLMGAFFGPIAIPLVFLAKTNSTQAHN